MENIIQIIGFETHECETDCYNHVIKEKMIFRGFNSAGISEAVQNADESYEKIQNPFREVFLLNC